MRSSIDEASSQQAYSQPATEEMLSRVWLFWMNSISAEASSSRWRHVLLHCFTASNIQSLENLSGGPSDHLSGRLFMLPP